MTSRILTASDLVAGYLPGVDILRGVSLSLDDGELVGIIGPNGAGKSTLVKALFGLVGIRSGTVDLGGRDITDAAAHDLVAAGI
nr:ATP-binding cassette domain-containing protein [Actinomycetota bacterium]NIS35196.1 ATP-binding cassette domain-containing protein [Actinomycetota bacterium]NIT97967.1 ATP-binding cassette domain-containing protein [Actinomycetota bacterium]NIU21613.1 ATP-binding cassette domain-containing protein [Actinomycetota bacterium]NIU69913.1 ATP-binding cassette domain-containing protein [Actinomycetota bacterium]